MYGQLPLKSDIVGHEGVGSVVKGKYPFMVIKLPKPSGLDLHGREAGSDAFSYLVSKRVALG